jgi:UDPglucose 6-dehydrogenase
MKIAVVGTGYVGLVTGVVFADLGNEVLCVDIDASKVDALTKGSRPFTNQGWTTSCSGTWKRTASRRQPTLRRQFATRRLSLSA